MKIGKEQLVTLKLIHAWNIYCLNTEFDVLKYIIYCPNTEFDMLKYITSSLEVLGSTRIKFDA